MIRKFAAIMILLLMVTSLASGSIASAGAVRATGNSINTIYSNDSVQTSEFVGLRASPQPYMAETGNVDLNSVSDPEVPTLVVYMAGSHLITPDQPAFDEAHAPPQHSWLYNWASLGHDNRSFIDGVTVVYHKGSDAPRSFQVQFEGTWDPMGPVHKFVAHKKLDTPEGVLDFQGTIMLNSTGGVVEGTALTESSQYNNTISQGDDNWHTVTVGSSTASLNIDVKWQNSSDNLRLMIYTADGYVLGPYYDSSDGKTDGQILVNVSNSAGLSPGQWYLKVTGSNVAGKDAYYVKTY